MGSFWDIVGQVSKNVGEKAWDLTKKATKGAAHLALKKELLCPYCFEYFEFEMAPFRCTSPANVCSPEKDEIYEKYWEDSRRKGKVLFQQGEWVEQKFKKDEVCDKCSHTTKQKICPSCHKNIPDGLEKIDNNMIAVIGGTNVGKSHYLAILINQLKNEIGPKMDLMVDALDDDTRKRFHNQFYKPIYEDGRLIHKTQSSTTNIDVKLPLIYRINTLKDNKIIKSILMIFFDTAGEDLNNENVMLAMNKYIYRSNGIIMLVDPLQIHNIQKEISITNQNHTNLFGNNSDILSRVIHIIEKGNELDMTDKIKIPIAISFTKMDILDSIINKDYQIGHLSNHEGGYDADDIEAVSSEIKSFLLKFKETAFVQMIEAKFSKYSFFGVSALGHNPENGQVQTILPRRVEDPLFWIMYQNKLIKRKKDEN